MSSRTNLIKPRHDVSQRHAVGAPNYDRIIERTQFDPLTELVYDLAYATQRHEKLEKQLKALESNERAVRSEHHKRLSKELNRWYARKIELGKFLVKFGEAQPVKRVAVAEVSDAQVTFAWGGGDDSVVSDQ